MVWVAHRHELLEQAAVAFYRAASRMQKRESLRVRIVSGMHSSVTGLARLTMWSFVRSAACPCAPRYMRNFWVILGVFLVIDEGHHAPAMTYRRLIEFLQRCTSRRIFADRPPHPLAQP